MFLIYGCLSIILFISFIFVLQIVRIQEAVKKLTYDNKPFTRNVDQTALRFLFVGDSTALGTGAIDSADSVAGRFGHDFPQASIENISANGKRLTELVQEFPSQEERSYDLVVVQIGGNDILKFSSFIDIDKNILKIIEKAKKISKHVIILHSGNVGLAPIFIWPFDQIMTHRSRQMREIYIKRAKENGVFYADLFTERENDLFLKDVDRYYSLDRLHPSGEGYRWWYERIRWTLNEGGVSLK